MLFLHTHGDAGARRMAMVFSIFSAVLAVALLGTWLWLSHLTLTLPDPERPQFASQATAAPASPLLVQYQLDLPGRGEVFPALATSGATDYWPLALMSISNTAKQPVLQLVSAEVKGWSRRLEQTVIVGPQEVRTVQLNPELLPRAFNLAEIHRATLEVKVTDLNSGTVHAQARPVLIHSGGELYWGKQFANAQVIARWVTPHDPAVLSLVSDARRFLPQGRMPGYGIATTAKARLPQQVQSQARAVFEAIRKSGFSYVSSIFTFGDFTSRAQRIRLPRETLTLDTANCIDVSVAFASAIENLGMNPVIVVVPGHAFAGVRLGPDSSQTVYLDLTVLPRGTYQQAVARAQDWLKKTPPEKVLIVDVASARRMGLYPLPSHADGEERRAEIPSEKKAESAF
jgi:hypothetical protein